MVTPFSEHRLPPGRHGLDPEVVASSQRWRLLGAGAAIFAEHGYTGTTARRIARRAAVSSSTFYTRFGSVPAVLQACFEGAAESLLEVIDSACRSAAAPASSTESALQAALGFAASEPQLVGLIGPELAVAQAAVADKRERLVGALAALLSATTSATLDTRPASPVDQLLTAAALAVVIESRTDPEPRSELARELAVLLTRGRDPFRD